MGSTHENHPDAAVSTKKRGRPPRHAMRYAEDIIGDAQRCGYDMYMYGWVSTRYYAKASLSDIMMDVSMI